MVQARIDAAGECLCSPRLVRVIQNQPFWRGDVASSSRGSGLGLALAKRIVESLGGQIRVQSEPARGSRFAIVVPEGP